MHHSSSFYTIVLVCLMAFTACNPETNNLDLLGMFYGSSPRADIRFTESQTYCRQHGVDTIPAPADSYRVYLCADTHIDSTRRNFEHFIAAYRQDELCPVAIHLGDLINAQSHFEFAAAAYTDVPRNPTKQDTLYQVLGNHDIYFGQWSLFRHYWRTSSCYFLTRTPSGIYDFFLILDTAEGTLGRKQTEWLRQLLEWAATQPFRHRVVCTHTHLFMEDFSQGHTSNLAVEETYELMQLFAQSGVEFYFCGHDHTRSITSFRGCTFLQLETIQDPVPDAAYLVATFADRIAYDFVPVIRK